MSKTINIRLSDELKADAEAVFADIGISLSEAVRMFIKQTVNSGKIPFQPHAKQPNAETLEAFRQAENGETETYTLDEFKQYLQSEQESDE